MNKTATLYYEMDINENPSAYVIETEENGVTKELYRFPVLRTPSKHHVGNYAFDDVDGDFMISHNILHALAILKNTGYNVTLLF